MLVERISDYSPLYTAQVHAMQSMPALADHPASGIASRALATLARTVDQQAAMMAFLDCFAVLVVPTALAALLTFGIKRRNPTPKPVGGDAAYQGVLTIQSPLAKAMSIFDVARRPFGDSSSK